MKRTGVIGTLLGVAVLFSIQAPAQAQDATDPKQWADSLFDTLLIKGESDFTAELKNTFIGKEETGSAEIFLGGVEKTRKLGGALTVYDYVSQQQIGPRLRRLKYVTYNERFFLVCQLAFYKGDHGWELFGADLNSESAQVPWQ